jgi:tetratricopeptide (TPR) repeat protein
LRDAERYAREAVEIARRVHAGDHPDAALALNNLAGALRASGALEEAIPLFREAVPMLRRLYGAGHPNTRLTQFNLAGALKEHGDLAAAESAFREHLALTRQYAPDQTAELALGLTALAFTLVPLGRDADAEEVCRDAITLARAAGVESADTATLMAWLGETLIDQGCLDEASDYLAQSLELRGRTVPLYWTYFHTLSLVGDVLRRRGAYADAEPLLLAACFALWDDPEASASRRAEARGRLIALWRELGMADEFATPSRPTP